MAKVDRTFKTHEYWRKTDKEYAEALDRARERRVNPRGSRPEVPDFPEFSEKYFGQRVFWHQQQWHDLLEGRAPRRLHPAEIYIPGSDPQLFVVNTPPEHSKSTSLTVNRTVWEIVRDPNIRVIVVSKTQSMAKKFLYQMKQRLTHPRYRQMHADFAPAEGFDYKSDEWSADKIYISPELRDSGEKDPTVEAIGIGGQIYGARADLIILDDCVDLRNAGEFEKQLDWIQQEVLTRLSPEGKLLLIGTRVASVDLYSEILKADRYGDGVCPWTYFAQPAVLEYADDVHDWVTLWPYTDQKPSKGAAPNPDGLYPMWDGPRLARRRANLKSSTWSMVYMQQQVAEDAIFPPEAVAGCVNGMRASGPLVAAAPGHPRNGSMGMYIVGGLDPAMAGNTAAVVMAVDRQTKKRWVLDAWTGTTTPTQLRELIKSWTVRFGMMEWRVEKNAFQIMLTQDPEVRTFLASHGCLLTEHFTGSNKISPDFGVGTMSMLFDGWREKRNLIDLPSNKQNEGVKQLIEQLVSWVPDPPKRQKTDLVMALWFAELRAQEIANFSAGEQHFIDNPFLGEREEASRLVLDFDEIVQSDFVLQGGYL